MSAFDDFEDDDFMLSEPDFSSSPSLDDDGDEFDRLRRASARNASIYNDLDDDVTSTNENRSTSGSSFSLNNFTAGQKLVLAILTLLNICVIGIGILVVAGILGN